MGMSRYTRFKLKAHDRGEDRHNKGVSYLKKQSRLDREHQEALEAKRRQRGAKIKTQRELRRLEFVNRQRALGALQQMTQGLFEAAGLDQPQVALRFLVKEKVKREPVTVDRTYRIRRLDSEEVTEVQVTVNSSQAKPM